jgi:hypothetical protein
VEIEGAGCCKTQCEATGRVNGDGAARVA